LASSWAWTPSQAAKASRPWSSWRLAADHGHDPLVVVLEGLAALAAEVVQDVPSRPVAGLLGDAAQLGQGLLIGGGDVGEVPQRVDGREAVHGQVGPHVDPPAPALGQAGAGGQGGGHQAAAPHGQVRRDGAAVAQGDAAGGDLLGRGAQLELDPAPLELPGRIGVGLVGEGRQQGMAEVDQDDPGPGDGQVGVQVRQDVVDQLGHRPGGLDPGGAATDDDEGERALVDQLGVGAGVLEQLEHPGADPFGVLERVQREGEPVGPRGVEEVRLGTGGQHDHVGADHLPIGQRHRRRRRVDRHHLAGPDLDVVVLGEHGLEVEPDVAGGELSGRHLVQQRQELVVGVAVEQGDPDTRLAGQPPGAGHAGEAAADDHHVGGSPPGHDAPIRASR
jgi:hypothetical protein